VAQGDLSDAILERAMASVTVNLTGKLAEFVERRVASGDYESVDQVVGDAVDRMSNDYQAKFEELRAAIMVGVEQIERGEYSELDVMDILDDVLERRRNNA